MINQHFGSTVLKRPNPVFTGSPQLHNQEAYKVRSIFPPSLDFPCSSPYIVPHVSLPPLLHQYLSSLNYYSNQLVATHTQHPPSFSFQSPSFYPHSSPQTHAFSPLPQSTTPQQFFPPNPYVNTAPSGMGFATPINNQSQYNQTQPFPQPYQPKYHHPTLPSTTRESIILLPLTNFLR